MVVVPVEEESELPDKRASLKRNQDQTSTFDFHGENESFQNCDASMLGYGSEALCDSSRQTPVDFIAAELPFLIGDQVLRFRSDQEDDAIEQGDDRLRIRPSLKHFNPVYAT